jgi:peptidyl-Asp metalloendopeptidase
VLHRIRLVGPVQLNYTETNSNQSALEQVTGILCAPACMPTPVPVELVPLRTAREQLGADLVVLLRPNRAPQHESCGTGWLIGEGGNLIGSSDAPFGYSIASDGADIDESSGLLVTCNDYTVAQQLGLNMGQAYNPEDAPNSGTHAYSYGYRQTQATGFHTIMALPLIGGSQFAIPHFSNPNVSFNGMATGTASQDNARSLNLSMPLIAQFRAEAASINQIFSSGFE